jgi:hypothetical protein
MAELPDLYYFFYLKDIVELSQWKEAESVLKRQQQNI